MLSLFRGKHIVYFARLLLYIFLFARLILFAPLFPFALNITIKCSLSQTHFAETQDVKFLVRSRDFSFRVAVVLLWAFSICVFTLEGDI